MNNIVLENKSYQYEGYTIRYRDYDIQVVDPNGNIIATVDTDTDAKTAVDEHRNNKKIESVYDAIYTKYTNGEITESETGYLFYLAAERFFDSSLIDDIYLEDVSNGAVSSSEAIDRIKSHFDPLIKNLSDKRAADEKITDNVARKQKLAEDDKELKKLKAQMQVQIDRVNGTKNGNPDQKFIRKQAIKNRIETNVDNRFNMSGIRADNSKSVMRDADDESNRIAQMQLVKQSANELHRKANSNFRALKKASNLKNNDTVKDLQTQAYNISKNADISNEEKRKKLAEINNKIKLAKNKNVDISKNSKTYRQSKSLLSKDVNDKKNDINRTAAIVNGIQLTKDRQKYGEYINDKDIIKEMNGKFNHGKYNDKLSMGDIIKLNFLKKADSENAAAVTATLKKAEDKANMLRYQIHDPNINKNKKAAAQRMYDNIKYNDAGSIAELRKLKYGPIGRTLMNKADKIDDRIIQLRDQLEQINNSTDMSKDEKISKANAVRDDIKSLSAEKKNLTRQSEKHLNKFKLGREKYSISDFNSGKHGAISKLSNSIEYYNKKLKATNDPDQEAFIKSQIKKLTNRLLRITNPRPFHTDSDMSKWSGSDRKSKEE